MITRPFLVGTVVLAAVCGTPTSPCACEPQRTHLVVQGAVRSGAGSLVPGARVYVVAISDGAPPSDPALSAGDGVATTDAQGHYQMRVLSPLSPTSPVTARVAVVRAPGDTVRVDATGASLRSERQVADTLVVDIVVP